MARGAAPAYSTDSIVNGANYAPGPFAPNSILTVFGAALAASQGGISADLHGVALPYQLGSTSVYIANMPAPLLYVSPTQINLLVPGNLTAANVPMRVVVQSLTGPSVTMTLVLAAPQLFATPDDYVIAQHGADYSQITPGSPASPGEVIVVYATGLGATTPNPSPGEIPGYAGRITSAFQLLLAGSAVPSASILYAGLTPGCAGVYQINVMLPADLSGDVEIRAASGDQISLAGVKLPMKPSAAETR